MYSLLLCNLTFWRFLREEGESIRMQELLNESFERRGGARIFFFFFIQNKRLTITSYI